MTETHAIEVGDSYLGLFDGGAVRDQFVLIEGKRGTAKTRSILTALVCRALKYPGSRWLLSRSTRTLLSDTVLVTLAAQVLPLFRLKIPKGNPENWHRIELGNGSEFIPMGLDDPSRGQSREVAGIYVAEGVEIPLLNTITSLAGAMRQDCGVPFFQCIVDCNPGSPNHPLNLAAESVPDTMRKIHSLAEYQRLVEHNQRPSATPGKWKRIVTQHYDNPGYFDPAAWKWTSLGAQYLKTLENLTGHFKARWLYGLWKAAEGAVFPEFDPDVHVCDDFEPPSDWPMVLAFDPGWGTTACLWVAVSPNGCFYVIDEIYEGQKSMEEHCEEIKKRNRDAGRHVVQFFGDPNEMFSSRAQGPSCADQASKYGIRFVPWPADKGSSFTAGVEAIRHVLSAGKIRVCRRCTGLQSNFSAWSYKKNAKGEMLEGADQYEKGNDHAMDCLRGVLSSGRLTQGVVGFYRQPSGIIQSSGRDPIREALRGMREAGVV
jgi:hypothetical protein